MKEDWKAQVQMEDITKLKTKDRSQKQGKVEENLKEGLDPTF